MLDTSGQLNWRRLVSLSPEPTEQLSLMLARDHRERPRDPAALANTLRRIADAPKHTPAPQPTPRPTAEPIAAERPSKVASAPSSANKVFAAGAITTGALIVLGLLISLINTGESPYDDELPPPTLQPIKDLTFGMTIEEARAAWPELADVKEQSGEQLDLTQALMLRSGLNNDPSAPRASYFDTIGPDAARPKPPLIPGYYLKVETTLAGQPASCTLRFMAELGQFECTTQLDSPAAAAIVAEHIHKLWVTDFGIPHSDSLSGQRGRRDQNNPYRFDPAFQSGEAMWEDFYATLKLSVSVGKIHIHGQTKSHKSLMDELVNRGLKELDDYKVLRQRREADEVRQRLDLKPDGL
jgi:hypothetical protein